MSAKIKCPGCKTVFAISPADRGTAVRCPECSRKLNVPAAPDAVEPAKPKSKSRDREDSVDISVKKSSKKKSKPKKNLGQRAIWFAVGGGAGMLVLFLGIFGIIQLFKTEQPRIALNPEGEEKKVDPGDDPLKPIVPVQPKVETPVETPLPAFWKAKADPQLQKRERLAESTRIQLGFAEPLFASAEGPFYVDMPYARVNERTKDKVVDLRTGKEIGSFSSKSVLHGNNAALKLSPDGQHVAGVMSSGVVDVWKVDAEEPTAKLAVPGTSLWFDYRSAEELVTVAADAQQWTLQVWDPREGKSLRKLTTPRQPEEGQLTGAVRGEFSPGRKQLALAVRGNLLLIDLDACSILGVAPPPVGACGSLVFSADGSLLRGIYHVRQDRDVRTSVWTWNVNDGKRVRPPVPANLPNFVGECIAGPDDDTVIIRNRTLFAGAPVAPAQVVDCATGTPIFDLPYVPIRWERDGQLLAFQPVTTGVTGIDTTKKRDVIMTAFDQQQYLAKAGGARNAVAQRPKASDGDRTAVKAIKPDAAAWAVQPAKHIAFAKLPSTKLDLEEGDTLFAHEAGQVSSVFPLNQNMPVVRMSLHWRRYDLATGKSLGDPVELWPWIKRDDLATAPPVELGELPAAVSADGKRLVLRDPAHASWGRVDVWEADGKRILGLLPYGGASVEWHGWSTTGNLLTIGAGKLTAWEVPSGKALFEVAGNYGGRAELAPNRSTIVVPSIKHLDVIDTATGACLGRMDSQGALPRSWTKLAFSTDSRRLAGVSWEDKKPRSLVTWDLETGKVRDTISLPPSFQTPVFWYGDRHLLVANEVIDLDLKTAVAKYDLGSRSYRTIFDAPDGRLWMAADSLKGDAFATSRIDPREGVASKNGWRRNLVTLETPDPKFVAELPGAAPAKRNVVFHPGMDVALDLITSETRRTDQIEEQLKKILTRQGFKINQSSKWKVVVRAEQTGTPLKGALILFPIPGVKGTVHLHGPNGVAGGGELRKEISNTPSRYEKARSRDGSRNFEFEGERPIDAFADEYWDLWITGIEQIPWPRAVMQFEGKYSNLPVSLSLTAP